MANVEKVSVSLTLEYADIMRQVVEAGEYAPANEVMREALRDWKFCRTQREQTIEELRRIWDAGIASGPATDGDQAFARMRERIGTKFQDLDHSSV
jgi:antitoxin ParD1/3/4